MAEDRIKRLTEIKNQAIDVINEAAKGDGTIPLQYQIREQVWLKGKHLKFPPSSYQTKPQTLWTLQDHQSDLISGVSTPTATIMEYPPHIPHITSITLL